MFQERFANVPVNLWKHYFKMFSERSKCLVFLNVKKLFLGYLNIRENCILSFYKHYGKVTWMLSKPPETCINIKRNIQQKCFSKTFHKQCINNVFMLTFWEHHYNWTNTLLTLLEECLREPCQNINQSYGYQGDNGINKGLENKYETCDMRKTVNITCEQNIFICVSFQVQL